MKLGTPTIGSAWTISLKVRDQFPSYGVGFVHTHNPMPSLFPRSLNIQVALKLLARGANGATALHYSSVEGSLEVTKAILESASEVEKLVTLLTCSVLSGLML